MAMQGTACTCGDVKRRKVLAGGGARFFSAPAAGNRKEIITFGGAGLSFAFHML